MPVHVHSYKLNRTPIYFLSFIFFSWIVFICCKSSFEPPIFFQSLAWLFTKSLQPTLAEMTMSCPVLPRGAVLPEVVLSFSPSKTFLLARWGSPRLWDVTSGGWWCMKPLGVSLPPSLAPGKSVCSGKTFEQNVFTTVCWMYSWSLWVFLVPESLCF